MANQQVTLGRRAPEVEKATFCAVGAAVTLTSDARPIDGSGIRKAASIADLGGFVRACHPMAISVPTHIQ
jgi:hypothetical protein